MSLAERIAQYKGAKGIIESDEGHYRFSKDDGDRYCTLEEVHDDYVVILNTYANMRPRYIVPLSLFVMIVKG
jgi:hypothetical protein